MKKKYYASRNCQIVNQMNRTFNREKVVGSWGWGLLFYQNALKNLDMKNLRDTTNKTNSNVYDLLKDNQNENKTN
ncbi:hypothetical protein BpHYR1_020930 [Brachionus plicatilis]|uniref:Uncharacterized protein n=1 Tax=Brachionus plicatilis TaxID=10195 RepID=A0A3M7RQK8_BRAPC|nr:hypothetical protein BpHYR1_020930 [Brachionus plicatilis]